MIPENSCLSSVFEKDFYYGSERFFVVAIPGIWFRRYDKMIEGIIREYFLIP